MDKTRLATLKQMMLSAKGLNEPWIYFFDHIAQAGLLDASVTTENPRLSHVLQLLGARLFQGRCTIQSLTLLEIPDRHFLHGACRLQSLPASLFYFTDIDVGMLSLLKSGRNSEVSLLLFSAHVVEAEGAVLFNALQSKDIQ